MAEANTTLSALGVLLEQHRGSLSKRQAARRAGISEGRWRQIVTGQQKAGGVVIPVNPRKDTVIAMAEAVGADVSDALVAAGFDPVDLPSQTSSSDAIVDTADAIRNDPTLIDEAKQHLLNQYALLQRLPSPVAARRDDSSRPEGESIEERRERLRLEHEARARRGKDGRQDTGAARRAVGDGGGGRVGGRGRGSRS